MQNGRRNAGGSRRQAQSGDPYATRRREMSMRREKERKRRNAMRLGMVALVLVVFIGAGVLLVKTLFGGSGERSLAETPPPAASINPTASGGGQDASGLFAGLPGLANATKAYDEMEEPHAVDSTAVDKLGIQKKLNVNGEDVESYERSEPISFGTGSQYSQLEGIVTFRGNNYRNESSYGTAAVSEKKLEVKWKKETGSLGKWTGNGWVGQPLIVKWPEETKKIMNLNDAAKAKADLVEVIYAGMDGMIHFYDLDTGEPTREDINIGQPFKGSGALDPRGIPMIYLGGGDAVGNSEEGSPKAFIYSLIDGKELYSFGQNDPFKERAFTAWDSSALVSGDTDTLIYPSENGILYTMKLNTDYDPQAGTLSVNPSEIVKMRYDNKRHRDSKEANKDNPGAAKYWVGMESSAVVWKNYLYIADNCGDLICVDLNKMKILWAQDTLDDTNCTPVLDIHPDGKGYIYVSTSLNWTADEANQGKLAMWKINATTGEKEAQFDYTCHTQKEPKVSGGVQATALLGKNSISDLLIFPVARSPKLSEGMLYAVDKNTMEKKWEKHFETETIGGYSWSSPIAVYDENGEAYIILCNTDGYMFLFDKNGNQLSKVGLGAAIEASPIAYGNTIVVGTRGRETYAIEIK